MKIPIRKTILITCLFATMAISVKPLMEHITMINSGRAQAPILPIGIRFDGLANYTKDIKYIGYFTDQNFNDSKTIKEYAHAQYLLAPSILVQNSTEHEYFLFVCSNINIAHQMMIKHKATFVKGNQTMGIILAKKRL